MKFFIVKKAPTMEIDFLYKVVTNHNTSCTYCSGLVVMGGDSRPRGRGFEFQHRILDGHFSHILL